MEPRLDAAACLPADGTAGLLVGRAWQTGSVPGPAVVVLRDDEAIDVTDDFPTVTHLLNAEAPAEEARAAAARGPSLGLLEALLANSAEAARDPGRPFLLAPCDLQALKACGVTFVRSLLVLAGKSDGVIKGQAAVTGQGLVGRVTAVGERASRVLLVTDINSRIPVRVDRTRERAVLAGNNSSSPSLIYLPPETGVQVGDRIVTSGHGGVFPKGIPVGIVTVVDQRDNLDRIKGAGQLLIRHRWMFGPLTAPRRFAKAARVTQGRASARRRSKAG